VVANVPHARMRTLYREADVFVLKSQDEAAAFSFIEAMSVGTPVIVNEDNGLTWYMTADDEGLFRLNESPPGGIYSSSTKITQTNPSRCSGGGPRC
jgi:glycosyltransferase involved in cell wall biosynthesis